VFPGIGFSGPLAPEPRRAFVVASMLVVVRLAARAAAQGITSGPVALIVTGDTGLMLIFALFVVTAIYLRRRTDVHRRLMLLASIAIVGPAIVRLPGAEALVPISVYRNSHYSPL